VNPPEEEEGGRAEGRFADRSTKLSWTLAVGRPDSATRFDLPEVDSGKSRGDVGRVSSDGKRARFADRGEAGGEGGGRPGNEPPVTCAASGVVEMSDLSARARRRVSSPVDQAPRCRCSRPTRAGTDAPIAPTLVTSDRAPIARVIAAEPPKSRRSNPIRADAQGDPRPTRAGDPTGRGGEGGFISCNCVRKVCWPCGPVKRGTAWRAELNFRVLREGYTEVSLA